MNEKGNGKWQICHLINQGEKTSSLIPGSLLEKNLMQIVPSNILFGAAISEVSHFCENNRKSVT